MISLAEEKTNKLVYIDISNKLRKKILEGEFANNKLPPERKLADEFAVNRITLRKALDILEREKLIYKLGTKGTFVRKRKISKKRTEQKTIAFVLVKREMLDRFHSVTMLNLEKASRKWNCRIMFFSVSSPEEVDTVLGSPARDGAIDGIIFSGLVSPEIAKRIYELDIFAVLLGAVVNPKETRARFDRVYLDSYDYAYKAVNHFIENGKKEIAFVNGNTCYPWFKNAEIGYRDALKTAGIRFKREIVSSCSQETPVSAFRAMKEILDNSSPDAVFVTNERLLPGILDALREENMRLGVDIDIITVDSDATMFTYTGVKAVTFNSNEFAAAALELLFRRIANPEMAIEETLINTKIIEGGN